MKASLFVTCLVDNFFPNVAESMVRILDDYGVDVDFPREQTCCGQPAFNSGYVNEAREVAKTLLAAFDTSDYVISPSGSCTGMIHHYYRRLFGDDTANLEKAKRLIDKTYEFSQFFVNILKVKDIPSYFPHVVTYHPSCHGTRLLGVKDEPLELIKQVQGLQLIDLPYASDCCGFGGTFAVKMGEISSAMVSEKVEHIQHTGAEILVGTDMGCLMNIGGRLRHQGQNIRVMHVAELLCEGMQNARARKGLTM